MAGTVQTAGNCESRPADVIAKSLDQSFELSSGRLCRLIRVRNDWIPRYYLLTFPEDQGEPNEVEVAEMISLGTAHAKKLASETLGDSEAFGLLYSGYSARREKGWHVHIVLLGSRWRKAWMYFVLSIKNLLQALRLRRDDAPRLRK